MNIDVKAVAKYPANYLYSACSLSIYIYLDTHCMQIGSKMNEKFLENSCTWTPGDRY